MSERRNQSRSEAKLGAALSPGDRRLRALIEHGMDAIVLIHADDTMRYVSPSVKRFLGYAPEQLTGRPSLRLYHPDDAPRMQALMAGLLKTPGGRAGAEVRLRHHDGTWRWSEATATNLLDDPGVRALVVTYHDATERRSAEDALRRLAALVESSDDAIIGLSLDAMVQTWNAGAERTYLYSAEEMIGRPVSVLTPPGVLPLVMQHRERIHRGESLRQFEAVRVRKDGTPITVSLTASPVRDESGRVVAVATVSRDVTGRKSAETELRRRAAHLEALNEIVGQAVSASDLTQLLSTALATIMKTLGCEIGAASVADVRIARGLRTGTVLLGPFAEPGGACAEGNVAVEDWRAAAAADKAVAAAMLRLGLRASLVAPIPAAGRSSLGGIAVASAQPRSWLPDEIRLVETAGKQVGAAVQRLRLFREVQQHTQLMARLVSIIESLNRSLVASEAVIAIGAGALDLCAADRAAVFVHQPDGTVICPWSLGLSGEFVAETLAHRKDVVVGRLVGEPAAAGGAVIDGRVVDTDRPFLFNDTLAYPGGSLARTLAEREGIRATGFLPLPYEGRVIAAVVCYYDAPRVWTGPEQEVFLSFCWQAAIALQNASLREGQAQRAAALEVLADVSNRLRAAHTLQEMYPILVEQALALFNAVEGSLALLDASGQQFTRVHTLGRAEPGGSTFPLEGSLAGPVVKSGVAWVSPNLPPQASTDVDEVSIRRIGPLVIVPVRSEQDVIGMLALGRPRGPAGVPFTEAEVRLLQAIAEIGGTAIRRARLYENLEQSYIQMVLALARTMDARDTYTSGHSERIAVLAERVARALGCGPEEMQNIRWAALLHDIGKVGVPDDILRKPGTLTAAEWEVMRQHPVIGESILVSTDRMRGVAKIVRHHQERWDGTGYPDGLRGEAIPVGARILAVVDAYSAITDSRPYKAARTHEEAIAELRRCAGTQFDPQVVHIFCRIVETAT